MDQKPIPPSKRRKPRGLPLAPGPQAQAAAIALGSEAASLPAAGWPFKLVAGVLAVLGGIAGGGAVPGLVTQSQLRATNDRLQATAKQVEALQSEQSAFRAETGAALRHITDRLDRSLDKRLTGQP
jgi:hypothetical protein